MNITFLGATKTVTGSNFLVEGAGKKFLVDCGMYQGKAKDELENEAPFLYNPEEIDFMLLTHAHIDHSGRIPKAQRRGARSPCCRHPAEQKLWKRLHVRKWQAKIPDMSRIFVKIMPEKKLTKENYENLPRMIEETCVAEWTHILLSIAGLGLLKIWSGVGGVCITIIYIVLGNLPFIVVQRYNRPRLQKLFAMQQRKK